MGLFPGDVVKCRKADTWCAECACDCPVCRFPKVAQDPVAPKKPDTVSVKLSRRQFQLIYEILDAYEVECASKRLKKGQFSIEHVALQLLETDTAVIVDKLREALGR